MKVQATLDSPLVGVIVTTMQRKLGGELCHALFDCGWQIGVSWLNLDTGRRHAVRFEIDDAVNVLRPRHL